ncbi:glycosyltransferase [Haloglomus halophilum]|uniref:glycosyltransferase n=1 Tax=Haloglomus halophilum TaxID=2962672 RepID=UPI0020C9CA6C|nr:glycosyltransferase family A protein [Haloglomus halophilum]
MESPRASIIIRCYNEREHIEKLLHGIFEQRMNDFEVILVDSGSTDGTIEVAKQYPIDEVVYIPPDKFSFGRALNYGCKEANGEFCVFASAHVYPTRVDWLENLLDKFDEDIALVYGKQRGNHVTKYPEKRVFRRWFPEEDVDYQSSPFCNNANAAIRRSVWEEFRYDESLTGLEDLDWAKRVQETGWHISYASDAEIIHVHDETPREVYNRYRREAIAHKQIFPDQEFTFGDFLKMFGSNTVMDYIAAAREGKLLDSIVEIPRFRLMQFWGTYRGFARDKPVSDRLWRRFYYPDRNGYPSEEHSGGGSEDDDLRIEYPKGDELPGSKSIEG